MGEHLSYGRAYAGPTITEFDIEIQPDLPSERASAPSIAAEAAEISSRSNRA